jgi:hypothetical protein
LELSLKDIVPEDTPHLDELVIEWAHSSV